MKKLSTSLILLIGFFFWLFYWLPPSPAAVSQDQLNQKHRPYDEFFLQRSSPDGQFSLEAFATALQQVKTTLENRTNDGFNEAWIQQGPGNVGARINTVAVNPQNEAIIYVGFSGGGVFKTSDGGQSWAPIFDDQVFLAIGDIVLDPTDPDIVYVGTGDVNISGYPFIGDGLYRSMDGGNTWEHLGLSQQRIISKIVIDPSDPDILYVGCMGLPFERNTDRGLYKSVDGGNTWERILFLSSSAGVIDVLINPQNPQILYAAGWNRIRNNSETITYGTAARIYKSTNGGANWTTLSGGLPNDVHDRIGLAMSGTDPDVLLAKYVGTDSELEGVYKTTDGGLNWTAVPTWGLPASILGGFGWYFGKIRVNPNDDNDILLLGVSLWRTVDGGQNWVQAEKVGPPPNFESDIWVDKHDLLFLPSGDVLLATDGGLYRSDVSMSEWEDIENIPATQFYRVAYNPHAPQNYYGGAQDHGTLVGNASGIDEWQLILGGDGFRLLFDPLDPDRFFAEMHRGRLIGTLDGGTTFFDGTEGIESDDRRNWDMPYQISAPYSSVLYAGTYRVYKSTAEGVPNWTPISKDLTRGNIWGGSFNTISTLHESLLLAGLLYVGTSDGLVWRKEETEFDWTPINSGLPNQYVTDVKASSHYPDHVFVAHSGYRENEFIPHIHRSDDRGGTWTDISSDLPELAINDLLILPNHADSVLFVATDGGVFGSLDGGGHWERLGDNMPIIAVFDLVYNEAKNEVVAGTFARSIMSYPLDSLIIGEGTIVSQSEAKPIEALQMQCYPNPSNDQFTLEYKSPNAQKVSIRLYSMSGKEILSIEPGHPGAGIHKQRINTQSLGNGVYILKMHTGKQQLSQKLILNR